MKKQKKRKLTRKQAKLVQGILEGKTQRQAAIDAGYSDKHPDQSAHQALEQIKKRMPDVMDELGLTDHQLIEKYLVPLLGATEAKFFAYRKTIKTGRKKPQERLVQVIEERRVEALGTRTAALDMAFKLKGSGKLLSASLLTSKSSEPIRDRRRAGAAFCKS